MDINIQEYVQNGERIKANECILCLHCIGECPQGALSASIGFDISSKNKLR
jgi:formate hydrogenlyase subunit 6/NADH:ubiquinone oxidoreductase subunit I